MHLLIFLNIYFFIHIYIYCKIDILQTEKRQNFAKLINKLSIYVINERYKIKRQTNIALNVQIFAPLF